MKKIFIVTGELSGDQSGAWYLKKIQSENEVECGAVGGDFLKNAGAKIYQNINKLNIVGILEIFSKLKFIFNFLNQLSEYIIKSNFEEVVLVDFPGFNLMLANRLKKLNPDIKIVYLSPPQLWIWGEWRIKKLKKYCDKLIVLYPFEVEWYKKRGLQVEFLGNPICDKLSKYFLDDLGFKKNQIAILPGSRKQEIKKLIPVFAQIVKSIKYLYPKTKIFLPVAQSLDPRFVEIELRKHGLYNHGLDVNLIFGEDEKLKVLKDCCLAITKPGTVSLELALLNVPSIIFYKTSWITYFLAKPFVKVKYMGLPNLFLEKPVFKEFIQINCNANSIFEYVKKTYEGFSLQNNFYKDLQKKLEKIRKYICS